MDTKAVVHVGEYSRGGKSRTLEPIKALDHDMRPKQKMVPGGILEVENDFAFLFFSSGGNTSDFLGDGLDAWWKERKAIFPQAKRLVINLDNGPDCSGRRTQFLKRVVEFSDASGLEVRLAYFPPYHSKYNPIERYWGGLEKSWNGYLLDSVETVLKRASSFSWKGIYAGVKNFTNFYPKGITLAGKEKKALENQIIRSRTLPWWDMTIKPILVHS
jgi:transposase